MKKAFSFLYLLLLIGVGHSSEWSHLSPELKEFIIDLETKTQTLQGGAIAILHKGKVIYKKTFGYKKGRTGVISSSTLFPLASISKIVSAVATGLLVDQKLITFQENFQLEALPYSVKLSHILSHTTGQHFTGSYEIERQLHREKILQKLKDQKKAKQPGESYRYNNLVYSLLAEALEKKRLSMVSAIGRLKRALKIKDLEIMPFSSFDSVAYPHERRTIRGKEQPGKTLPFPSPYPKAAPAAAGVVASLDSMIEFYKMAFGYRPDLISDGVLRKMQTPMTPSNDLTKLPIKWPVSRNKVKLFYGLGFRILEVKDAPKAKMIFHPGYIHGINTFIGHIPSEDMGIMILVNQRSGLPFKSGIKFWGLYI
jgi:beta-lactamase class C